MNFSFYKQQQHNIYISTKFLEKQERQQSNFKKLQRKVDCFI